MRKWNTGNVEYAILNVEVKYRAMRKIVSRLIEIRDLYLLVASMPCCLVAFF
jgi:hypothetical protein